MMSKLQHVIVINHMDINRILKETLPAWKGGGLAFVILIGIPICDLDCFR